MNFEKQTHENEEIKLEKRVNLVLEHNYEFARDYGFYDPIMCGSIDGTDEKPHDRGIIRALNSVYKPNLKVKSDPEKTLFIGRINFKTTEDVLEKIFSKSEVKLKTLATEMNEEQNEQEQEKIFNAIFL